MIYDESKFYLEEEKSFVRAVKEISCRGYEHFQPGWICKAVRVMYEDILCGYLLTCTFGGVKSFHGFKFITGSMTKQMQFTREYIEREKLEYSACKSEKSLAVLKTLGFREVKFSNGYHVMRKI